VQQKCRPGMRECRTLIISCVFSLELEFDKIIIAVGSTAVVMYCWPTYSSEQTFYNCHLMLSAAWRRVVMKLEYQQTGRWRRTKIRCGEQLPFVICWHDNYDCLANVTVCPCCLQGYKRHTAGSNARLCFSHSLQSRVEGLYSLTRIM